MKKSLLLLIVCVAGWLTNLQAQTVTVTSPNGGEIWPACAQRTITWTASGTSGFYNVDYSTNNGVTWASIATFLNATSLNWTVPNVQSTTCLIRVYDSYNNTIIDQSNAVFTINAAVRVTSPNGGENWQVGNPNTQQITWVASGTSAFVTIEYSIDAGNSWTVISNSVSATSGSFTWTIPNTPSSQCLVRVRDNNTPCMADVSDNLFTIVAPTPQITVTSPNTAVTWYVGFSNTIQWTSQYVTNPFVAIDYSTDGGTTWTVITTSTNNSGSFNWTVPNTPSSQARVRVKDAANPSTFDISNVNFTIAVPVPTITITSPNGGETWGTCLTYNISWSNTFVTGNYNIEYSLNNGGSWAPVISNVSGSTYTWLVPNTIATSSQCLIRVSSATNPAVFDVSNATFTINQVQYVAVTSPNGGESWQIGNPVTRNITWAWSGTTNTFRIEYSIDNGVTWNFVTTGVTVSSSPASFTWTLPNTPGALCLVRVSDANNLCRSDVSDNPFSLLAPTPVITVTNPNTATTFFVGSSYSITWTSQYVTNPFVGIDYSTDNGATWTVITSSTNNNGSFTWTVPNTPSTQCLVRVKDAANPTTIFDVSNVNFTIAIPVSVITVTSPNGGETWNSCTNYNISWTSSNVTGNFRLEYSTDGGTNWTIITTVTASPFNWQVPNNIATSSQCLIRVSSVNNPAITDISNATFTINQVQFIAITSPNGGEVWQVGNPTTRTISWAYSGTTTLFTLDYSVDNGATWINITTTNFPSSPASFIWAVPNAPSTQCLVRVRDANNTCRSDQSDAIFTIQPPTPTITVTSPNTAVTWFIGQNYSISWTNQFVNDPFVAIDYSADSGATWINIISAVNITTGSFTWTVPNTPTTAALVRVKSTANPATIFDISNVDFIIATPVPTITVTSPNGGETWNSCVNYNITWTSQFVTGNFRLDYSADNGTTWTTITTVTSSPFNWQVPNNIPTSTQCLIRVVSVNTPAVQDASNAVFTIVQVPYVAVNSPNGGEVWQVGNPASQAISWAFSGTTTLFSLEYSTDNGATWNSIITTNFFSSPATYVWTIPNTPSTQCLVRVRDANNVCRADQSNAVFTIQAPTPTITVTSPNTAVTWFVGQSYSINWTNQFVNDPFVSIEYSADNGITWINLVSSINTNTGGWNWTIPNTPTTTALVRVRSTINPTTIFDVSNVNFTIATPVPSITVNSPNGGEIWSSCTSYNISWSSQFVTGNFRIDYSTDNGATWTTITTTSASSFNWQVPNNIPTSTQCLIRVVSVNNPAVLDASNAVFTINQIQFIAVTSPNGGEVWQVGNPVSQSITWAFSGTTTLFSLEYSTDNGATWNSIITTNFFSSPATYVWAIPNTPSTQCLVRVRDANNTCRSDQSNAVFTIQPPTPTITVTSPNTAVTWFIGQSYSINWTSQFVNDPFVSIDYSIDNGATWISLLSSINTSTGGWNWTIPNTPSTTALVRVRSTANPTTITDVSNVNFTIAPPVPGITLTSPNGGEIWNSCVAYSISWSSQFVTGNFRLEYSADNGANWTTITTVTASPFSWTVPNNIPTSSQCLVRVVSVNNPMVLDASNNVFTINQVPYVAITSPNGGEIWQVGSPATRTISWAYSGTTTLFAIDYSTDNGATWSSIITANFSSSPANYTWTVPNTPSAQCLVRVRDANATCRSDVSDAVFTIQAPAPVITVTSPNTSVLWGVGGVYAITWTSQFVTSPFVAIDYSVDGGATWTNIVSAVNTTAGSFNWTVPNTLSNQCRVRVRDSNNPGVNDISNVNFSIVPAITVTSPNGGENWGGCTVSSVTWTAYGTSGSFRIEYSLDNGQNWVTVITSFAASGPNCTYSWTIPHVNSTICLVRVSDASVPTKMDISNNVFTMFPAIIVTNPSNNVAVFAGQTLNITWTSNGVSNFYNIDYSINGGSSWISIVFNTLITTNTFAWTVPATLSTNCLVRVTDNQNTCKQDISDGTFAISSSTANVVITAPNGGENWVACSQQTIQWSAQGTSGVYNIEYSVNGGSSWLPVATSFSSPGPNCSFTWTVPNNLSSNCLIRVTDAANNTRTDQSNAIFTISAFAVSATASSGSICAGAATTLTATGAASYTWQPGNLSGNSVSVTPSGTTTYTVTGTSGACSAVATVTVTVLPLPTVTASASSTTICQAGSVTLNATGATSYLWSPGGSLNISNIQSPTASPTATTTYTVTGTNSNGCSGTGSVTVTVIAAGSVSLTASQNNICPGTNVTLTASGASSYVWQPGNTTGSILSVAPTATTTYTVTGTSGSCSSTSTITITVTTPPVVNASASVATICSGSSTILTASGAATYLWTPGNLTGATVSVNPAVTTTYTVIGSNGSCNDTDFVSITVNPSPTVVLSGNTTICAGSTTTLTASGATSYLWQPGNLSGGSVTVAPTTTTTYTITGTTGSCTATQTITVVVNTLPPVAASSAQTICTGATATLSATGAVTYNWMPGNLSGASVAVTPPSTTTYTVTGTGSNGCTATATTTITVINPPTVTISGTTSLCAGSPTTLTANGAVTYTWQPGNLTGSSVTVTPASTTTYTITGTTGSCSATQTVTVTVNAAPVVSATASQTVACTGSPVTLTASGAATYTWQPGNLSGSSVSVSPVSATTYTVTGTAASGCAATATVALTVQTTPTVSVTGNSVICAGGSTTLTATGAANYVWQPGNFPGNTITVSPTSATTYTVTGSNGNCTTTQTFAVSISPSPTVTATASQTTVCSGTPVTLTANGASSYTWMPGNLTGTSVSVTPTATTTYTVTGVNGSCSSTATVTITVSPASPVTVSGVTSVCSGSSTTLTASGALSYIWMPGNLNTAAVTLTPSATTTYTVTGTSANGCVATETVTITVQPIPVVSATGPASVCAGSPATFTATGANSYTWQPGNFPGNTLTVTPVSSTTYTVTGTTAGCSATATVAVTVAPTPTITATASPVAVCPGGSATLTASGASSYTWQPGNLSGSSVSVSPTTTTTYTLTGVDGSCSTTATVTVTVNPVAPITVTGSSSVCAGSAVTLSATGAVSYTWQPGNLTGSSITTIPTGNTTYTVTGVNAAGCQATGTFAVTVLSTPTVSVTGPATICAGSPATFTASGAGSYTWQPGNFTGSSITVAPVANTTYTVTGSNGTCTGSHTFAVAVSNTPTVTATTAQPSVCTGGSATLTASGAAAYTWMPGNLSGSSITVTPASTTTYTVTGVNGSCSSTATVTVTVNSSLPLFASASQSSVCVGASTTLTATGASSYTWQPGNLSGSSVIVSPVATTTYTVTGTSGTCTGTQTVTVTTNTSPVVVVLGGGSVCAGNTMQLTASGASGYVWQPGNLSGNTVTVAPAVSTTYTVTGTGSNGCTDTASVSVGVNALPVISITGDGVVCAGNSAQLTASGAVSYTWQPVNLSGASVSVTPVTTTTYSVTGVNAAGCSATAVQTVSVTPAPVVLLSGNTQICAGATTQLFATGASSFIWQPGNLSDSVVTVSPAATTTYTVTGTSGNCTSTATITVVVSPSPIVTAGALQSSICAGSSTTLTAGGAGSYIWQPGNLSGAVVSVTPAATTTYTVTGISGNCSSTATVLVTVLPAPMLTLQPQSINICQGTSATLVAGGAQSYLWQPGSFTNDSLTVSPSATTVYTVTGTDSNGCVATLTATVNVVSSPLVNAVATTNVICAGDQVTLSAAGADVYSWVPGNFGGPAVSTSPSATTTYTVTGINSSGCSSIDTVTVQVNPLPGVTLSLPLDTVCSGEAPFILTGGQPAGGTYSGQGVLAGQFDPINSGSGLVQITYSWTDAATGCTNSSTDLIYVDPCAGVEETVSGNTSFTLYPNPTDDRLTLVYQAWSEPVTVVMYNALGQQLSSFQLTGVQTEISLRDLPVGVYQLTLITAEGTSTQKVIKQ
ncbi:MAG: T9SS type A sorting domain-containing protein [Bacteroidia bacterium]|jgi:hypothetical protein|nr:T9SS type A sorting domain-containing protein [Bacteroidia bacterium]